MLHVHFDHNDFLLVNLADASSMWPLRIAAAIFGQRNSPVPLRS